MFLFFNPFCYIFGGETNDCSGDCDERSKIIARLDSLTYAWSHVGNLNQRRYGHNVIEIGGKNKKIEETRQI